MKSRLLAPLSEGICRRNIRTAVSLRLIVSFFGRPLCKISSSFQAQGFEISSRAAHSSALEDDAYSELGPEISECSAKQIKLVTEKPDRFVKKDVSRREVAGKPLASDTRPKIKDIISTIGNASPTSKPKIGTLGRASNLTDDTKKSSNVESPRVSIMNVPPTIGLSELVEAISVFGKVSGAVFANRCCNIEFENADSSRRAILAGKIQVGSQSFPVRHVDAADVVAVRIKNINEETTDYVIHTRCQSVGDFVGLARRGNDVVDAFFNVRSGSNHLGILKKLNSTVIDLNRWSANVLTSDSTSSEASEAGDKLHLIVDKLKKELVLKRVYLEDLEALHASIIHLEDS